MAKQKALDINQPDSLRLLWTLYTAKKSSIASEIYLTLSQAKISEIKQALATPLVRILPTISASVASSLPIKRTLDFDS
jgi:hypothetical protein